MDTGREQTVPRRHRERLMVLVAGIVGLALVAVMITRTSEAAFSDTTANAGNYFHGGTVFLGDNGAGSAMFTIDAMDPGEVHTSCIEVTYSGSITSPSPVKVYIATPPAESADLGDHIELTIERGTSDATAFGDCGTFALEATPQPATPLSTFYGARTDYATGVGTWTPSATGESRFYRVTAELLESVPDSQEGATLDDVVFTWEIQS